MEKELDNRRPDRRIEAIRPRELGRPRDLNSPIHYPWLWQSEGSQMPDWSRIHVAL